MKKLALITTIMLAAAAMAQAPRRMQLRRPQQPTQLVAQWVDLEEDKQPRLLEPLLPFAEAVEKAKAGNPQGYYALAIHYAKGEVVEHNAETAWQFLQKADPANYSNAVFVATMLTEESARPGLLRRGRDSEKIHIYAGTGGWRGGFQKAGLTLTNSADVAAIRAGYERAFRLGVSAATNELARFERRVSAAQDEAKKRADAEKQKAENAKLADGLL